MFDRLFRKKSINAGARGLKRCLSTFDLTLLGIGCIIGTGIFVLTGIAAANLAGPAVVLSFVISGLACTFAALSYAELSSSVGGCGSAYGYAYVKGTAAREGRRRRDETRRGRANASANASATRETRARWSRTRRGRATRTRARCRGRCERRSGSGGASWRRRRRRFWRFTR